MSISETDKEESNVKMLLRNFIVELVIYGILVVLYFYFILRYLETYLTELFARNLTAYAIIGLLLIVLQGALLDAVTSFLLSQIKLDRFD